MNETAPLLLAEDVHKRYGGTHALRGATLRVGPAEVHGLVGENGSGKSTLLRILAGQILPDRARVTLAGAPLPLGRPRRSLQAGIATVAQETTLVPDLSIAENILLGRRMARRWWGLDWRETRRRAHEVLERLELDLDPRASVRALRPDEQQVVEVARAISMRARILVLDEPTSSLTDDEVEALFGVVRRLRREGIATIFVSHRLQEVLALADRVTVLRDGRTVAEREAGELDSERLIGLMVGRRLERPGAPSPEPRAPDGAARLRVRDLSVPGLLNDASLEVGAGEIVGVAGLVGAGRGELLQAVFGLHRTATGTIELDGEAIRGGGPAEAMRSGLAYVPPERGRLGLVAQMSTRENLMMAQSARAWRARRPPRSREARLVSEAVLRFRITGAANGAPVAALSGGNQQKVVLAKWMAAAPRALLLDEPTRGVDVGAKAEIYELLRGLRSDGLAVLLSSSETPELLLLCDRVLVMFRGQIVASLAGQEASEARIAHYATGHD